MSQSYAELLRDLFATVLEEPLEINIDGEIHVAGECCGDGYVTGSVCRRLVDGVACGARVHEQPVYGGIATTCERCDRKDWSVAGTYIKDSGGFCVGVVMW